MASIGEEAAIIIASSTHPGFAPPTAREDHCENKGTIDFMMELLIKITAGIPRGRVDHETSIRRAEPLSTVGAHAGRSTGFFDCAPPTEPRRSARMTRVGEAFQQAGR